MLLCLWNMVVDVGGCRPDGLLGGVFVGFVVCVVFGWFLVLVDLVFMVVLVVTVV